MVLSEPGSILNVVGPEGLGCIIGNSSRKSRLVDGVLG